MHDDLNDPYPLGWVLTYRNRNSVAPPGPRRIGVVAGLPVRDPDTGLELIPLATPGDLAGVPTAWIHDDDVIGIEPRPHPPEPGRG